MNLFRTNINSVWLLFLLTACGKDEHVTPSLEDGKSTVVYDLAGDTQASVAGGIDGKENRPFYPFLFRFSDKKQIWTRTKADSSQWLKTADWDIAFTGNYNSEVYLNNTTDAGNPGFGGPANHTAILLKQQSYEAVIEAPSDAEFDQSSLTKTGWSQAEGDGGWFSYDLTTHLLKALPNRTYVLRLPNGKYAKLQLLSAYKGNPPAVTDMYWPAPYFTFRYFVQQDGSRNLNTR
ncbi:HmuY protein [bacterium A37T11]|nr:HmuY protein [bacterium A37T11]